MSNKETNRLLDNLGIDYSISNKKLLANRRNLILASKTRHLRVGENAPRWNGGITLKGNYPCPQCGKDRYIKKLDSNRLCRKCYFERGKTTNNNEYKKKLYTINKEFAIKYRGGKCENCGVSDLPSACYHFHHKDKNDKSFGIARKFNDRITDIVLKELDKCSLLCANCHAIVHWVERGI